MNGRLAALGFAALITAFTGSTVAAGGEAKYDRPESFAKFPFSRAVEYNGLLFLSGDVGLGPDGKLVAGGIGPEARQTMENIKATLADHGLTMDAVVKCTVFLADISEWQAFNEIYAGYFKPERLPARSAFGASGLALGARVELECLAALPE